MTTLRQELKDCERKEKKLKCAEKSAPKPTYIYVPMRRDPALKYDIAAQNIIRQCLLFPEIMSKISSLFIPRKSQGDTRQSDNLDLVAPRIDFMKNSLSYHGSKLWNSLPSRTRNGSNLELKEYLLHKANTGK